MGELRLLISEQEIKKRIIELGKDISASYKGADSTLICVCILKGAILFFSDLIREIDLNLEIDFVRLASYGQSTSPSERVIFSKDMETSVKDRHVLIIEDIVDTGATIAYLKRVLEARGPLSVKVCALIHKIERRKLDVDIDFYGFKVKKGFLVGYGLDCAEKYRNLKGIYELLD